MINGHFFLTCEFPVARYRMVSASLSAGDTSALILLKYPRRDKNGDTYEALAIIS